jgi:hypothetical protein
MKKLMVICISFVLFVGQVSAQYTNTVPGNAELKYRMSMNAPHLYKSYKSGSTLSGFGTGLTLGGIACIIIGIATADKETVKSGMQTQVNLSGPGAAVFGAGMVCALAGTPIWIIGGTKKKNARNRYLREYGYDALVPVQPSPYLQLNTAPNGLGLAFVF